MSVINLLQCPFCLRPMAPPVFRCSLEHVMCARCRDSEVSCPACGDWLSDSRSEDTERLALQLPYPCPNEGCPEMPVLAQMSRHKEGCPYRLYHCTPCRPRCLWRGFRPEVLQHMRDEHPALLWTKSYNSVVYENFDTETSHSCTHAVVAHGRMFWSLSLRDADRRVLYEAVQLLGPADQVSTFRFILELYRQGDPKKSRVFCGSVQPETEDFTSGECVAVNLDDVKEFLTDNKQLFYSLKIEYVDET